MAKHVDNTNIPEIDASKFKLVQTIQGTKIKDEKFKTKSTTYAKDAFKRFCKNKSSVVAACIIAVLMLGSVFIPMISPYDTTKTQDLHYYLLPAKLFNAGTGFWDGCINQTGIVSYDEETESYQPTDPSSNGYDRKNAIIQSSVKYNEITYYDYASANFYGGTLRLSARNKDSESNKETNYFYYQNVDPISIKVSDNSTMKLTMDDIANIKDGYTLGQYRIRLVCNETKPTTSTINTNSKIVTLQDWSTNYGDDDGFVYDLSGAVNSLGATEYKYCTLRIEVAPKEDLYSYIMIKSIGLNSTDETADEMLKEHEIADANTTALLSGNDKGCWGSSGEINVYQAAYRSVSYRYDLYEHNFGYTENVVIGKDIIDKYVEKGWCEYDWNVGVSSFKRLSDKCPIVANEDGEYVYSQSKTYYQGQAVYQITTNVIYYRYLGLKSMPRFLFGSDDSGRDIFTHASRCLKNSLLLSIICCAICISLGLVWGAVSGYYGGRVDLIMERITDILSGVPSTVVLTLVLILLGRNTVTFAFAVCATGWIGTASLTRTQFYRFKNRESVLASRTLGAKDSRLIFKHILPNSLGTIVTSSVLAIPGFIFTEASLAYLKLGLDSGDSFGVLISDNQSHLLDRPMLLFFPIILLILLMISFNLFGNGLRDALNPTLKGGEQ